MSSSFPFIIPLNYQIKAKNNLSRRREQGGPDQAILPLLTFKPQAPEPCGFSRIFTDFGLTFAQIVDNCIPICCPYPIYTKIRPKYAKISEKRRLKSIARPTSGLCYLLHRRAHQVTMATFPPSQRGPGFAPILHPRYGFSTRSLFEHRGIINIYIYIPL